ncbi:MAG: ATP-binding protein [Candidatus Cryptobacteroides sp.]
MDTPFIYDRFVTGRNFVGRKNECNALSNLISGGENVVIYEPPKTGKTSVIQNTLFNMNINGKVFPVASLNMFNIRTCRDFLTRFGSAVIRSVASSPQECAELVDTFLDGTHFVFDRQRFSSCSEAVSLNWDPDTADMEKMAALPFGIAALKGTRIIVILDEFQSILADEAHWDLFKAMERVFKRVREEGNPPCSFIFCGSKVNAMKHIFEEHKFFYGLVNRIPLSEIDDREIVEHIVRGFLQGGKVLEKEQALGACRLFRNNIWYISHFSSVCNSLSKGYMNEGIMMDALGVILSIHEPRFISLMDSLTDFQISLLKAVLEGVKKFSATDIIEKYSLNSSANVKRVKDALKKKEVITFDENDEPVVLDPLFEYWARKYYFSMPV